MTPSAASCSRGLSDPVRCDRDERDPSRKSLLHRAECGPRLRRRQRCEECGTQPSCTGRPRLHPGRTGWNRRTEKERILLTPMADGSGARVGWGVAPPVRCHRTVEIR
jgi:hypothetical protein